jgi:opacity protein-like surface antigen
MKKTLLMVALLAGISTANAQDLKGRFFIGGDVLSFSSQSGKTVGNTTIINPSTTSFGIQPTIGYYLTDNWAIGAKLGFMNVTTDDNDTPDDTKISTNTITISPYIRYTMPIADKFAFFVDGGISYAMGTSKTTISPTPNAGQPNDTKDKTFGVNIGPGFFWFVRDNIAIQGNIATLIGFASRTQENSNFTPTRTITTNNFNLGLNGGIGLGMYYYFGDSK